MAKMRYKNETTGNWVEIPAIASSVEVVDDLDSESTTSALSANMGRELDETKLNTSDLNSKLQETLPTLQINGGYISAVRRAGVTDFNLALTEGYYQVGTVMANNPTGATNAIYGRLEVRVSDGIAHNNSSNWIWQEFRNTSDRIYTRQKVNADSWSEWTDATPTSYTLPTATTSTLGGVKTGTNITNSSGTISVPTATSSTLGVVKNGTNISNSSGTLSVATATTSTLGVIKPSTGLTVSSGTLTANLTNNLTSTSTTSALTANQGKVLNDKIDILAPAFISVATTTDKVYNFKTDFSEQIIKFDLKSGNIGGMSMVNNEIIIGDGISAIEISGGLTTYNSHPSTLTLGFKLNGVSITTCNQLIGATYQRHSFTPYIISVKSGDKITMVGISSVAGNINIVQAFATVRKVA